MAKWLAEATKTIKVSTTILRVAWWHE